MSVNDRLLSVKEDCGSLVKPVRCPIEGRKLLFSQCKILPYDAFAIDATHISVGNQFFRLAATLKPFPDTAIEVEVGFDYSVGFFEFTTSQHLHARYTIQYQAQWEKPQ